MTSDQNSHISGKALERYFDFNDALAEFHKSFNLTPKDERTIAILGATFLEMALEHILKAFLPEGEREVDNLFTCNQALGNFTSKINLSYCLGLIDKLIKADLDLVRKIRNKFAHDLYASFDDKQINSWTRELKFHKISMMREPPDGATDLDIFQVGVNQLISHLSGCIGLSRNGKRQTKSDFS